MLAVENRSSLRLQKLPAFFAVLAVLFSLFVLALPIIKEFQQNEVQKILSESPVPSQAEDSDETGDTSSEWSDFCSQSLGTGILENPSGMIMRDVGNTADYLNVYAEIISPPPRH